MNQQQTWKQNPQNQQAAQQPLTDQELAFDLLYQEKSLLANIASEVLEGFSMVKCRGIFSTHLHDLAASVDSINETCLPKGGVRIDNLVAAIEKGSRSFKILRERPDGKSYARDIAEKYGLSIDKIMEKVRKNQ